MSGNAPQIRTWTPEQIELFTVRKGVSASRASVTLKRSTQSVRNKRAKYGRLSGRDLRAMRLAQEAKARAAMPLTDDARRSTYASRLKASAGTKAGLFGLTMDLSLLAARDSDANRGWIGLGVGKQTFFT